ncbi:MAG: mono/diheme cytochrome c family protein [Planctomycetaceae bacterium]|jgi:mono/diheme cytochrome c family protein
MKTATKRRTNATRRLPPPLLLLSFIFFVVAADSKAADSEFAPDDAGFQRIIEPFFKQHCVRCHGPGEAEGEFRVDTQVNADLVDVVVKARWGEVINVLNSHEMPPEGEPQPNQKAVAVVVDWITQQMARAELHRRDSAIILRRMNRAEYRNTIRDLIGVDFDPSRFPQDPPTGGFDNNGGALTLSPLHLELYYQSAREIFDLALVEGPQPSSIRWRFEPESGDSDSNRVTYDGQRLIVNGGKDRAENGFKVMHHENWDRRLNARDFALPYEGEYIIRIRAAAHVPSRDDVVKSARGFLNHRRDEQMQKNPAGKKWLDEQFERDLDHFRTDRMYDYGPPRLKLLINLAGQPIVVGEIDVDASVAQPKLYEMRTRMTTSKAGISIKYAYSVPKELENFWMQGHDNFMRPELWVDWFELEGPVYDEWPPASHRRVLIESPLAGRNERRYARAVIQHFMKRAYRRPVSDAEVDDKLALFDLVRSDAPSFEEAIKTPLSAVLVSPHFLYLAEPTASSQTVAELSAPSSGRDLLAAYERGQSLGHPVLAQVRSSSSGSSKFTTAETKLFRQFVDNRGRKVRGRVVGIDGLKAKLESTNGSVFLVPLRDFTARERALIRALAKALQQPTPDTAPSTSADKPTPERRPTASSAVSTSPRPSLPAQSGDRVTTSTQSARRHLTPYELASRLSYFLWSTMPDDTLFELADSGRLTEPAVIVQQVERMLADERSSAFVDNFAGQWLSLREVGSNPPASDLYPRYDRHLEVSIVEESKAFFAEILDNDLDLMNFVKSDFVVVNERLARYYGIPGVKGDHFRRVAVPDGVHRGGIVTQASVLSVTSNGTRTSPVKRGTWVMKNLLGIDPGLPVANAGDIAPKVPGLDKATVRQRLEIHRSLPQCARCHNKIDPLGFALENFNAAGDWRDQEGFGYKGRIGKNDPVIDASAKMIDGTEFVGVEGLQRVLLQKEGLFLNCLGGKLFTYALGRELGGADQLHVKAAVNHLSLNTRTMKTLIKYVATSEPFLSK